MWDTPHLHFPLWKHYICEEHSPLAQSYFWILNILHCFMYFMKMTKINTLRDVLVTFFSFTRVLWEQEQISSSISRLLAGHQKRKSWIWLRITSLAFHLKLSFNRVSLESISVHLTFELLRVLTLAHFNYERSESSFTTHNTTIIPLYYQRLWEEGSPSFRSCGMYSTIVSQRRFPSAATAVWGPHSDWLIFLSTSQKNPFNDSANVRMQQQKWPKISSSSSGRWPVFSF